MLLLSLEHRFKVLRNERLRTAPDSVSSVKLYKVPDKCKIDLSALLIQKYGHAYIGDPRMPSLIKQNDITPATFLTGAEEAAEQKDCDNKKLHPLTSSLLRE